MTKEFFIVRKHPRVNVDFFADWGWGPECEYYDRVTSLSLGGCFLATKRELPSGEEIYIRLSANAVGKINLTGAVRYQLRLMEGAPPAGAGLQFIDLTSEGEEKLQAVLDNFR